MGDTKVSLIREDRGVGCYRCVLKGGYRGVGDTKVSLIREDRGVG